MVVGEIAQEKEIVVIGGGPGGYTAAIRAAQLGKDVLLIEQKKLGGICLHEGCIPSKAFVHTAKQANAWEHLTEIGYKFEMKKFDFATFLAYKEKLISQLRMGIESLCKANKIEVMYGSASFISANKIGIENGHHYEVVNFEQAIIATGTKAGSHKVSANYQLNSRELFQVDTIPEQLLLVGSDYIILEAAFAYSLLGTKVSIILEENNDFSFDQDILKELKRQLKKRKISLYPNAKSLHFSENEFGVDCTFTNHKDETVMIHSNAIYIEEEAKGNTNELGLERMGLAIDNNGFIVCDRIGKTNMDHIFAIGDVSGGPFLAAKAIKQGKAVAEIIAGGKSEIDLTWMPEVVHSVPPIAYVGFSEEQAKAAGYLVKIGRYQLSGSGFSVVTGNRDGFAKVVVDEETNRILGTHIIGEGAIELISTAVIGGEMVARDEDFLFPTYPHPSMNEAILEAMEDTLGLSIHQAPKRMGRKEKVVRNS
ncbi:FAD-dependent oxidoreductase [Heyndrickxia sporothermodurans]|uniref:dihydrolipoyl dehydrogenase family protein n=1 Tax=Heyndrickxia sporothermodurans TaxID=46224 RepID=UPI002DB7B49C|nr:FAD-dependent oxidoreductase [Heyndrickxia sporothermodurans]MEB6549509.1 FAD-dependent oxidoreductase [Heyndrickxia sporothermodurans]